MSLCVSSPVVRRSATTLTVLAMAALLAGCSTLGMGGSDGMVTNSTGQSANSRWGQDMPTVAMAPDARYLPPANIGGGAIIDPATAMPVGASPSFSSAPAASSGAVTTQDLPALSSPSVTSAPEMPAQVAAVPPSAPALSAPAAPSAPQLGVVSGDTYSHTIASGESLYTIARRYDVSAQDIMSANQITAPDRLQVGQQLIIPGRADLLAERGQQPTVTGATPAPLAPPAPAANDTAPATPAAPAATPAPAASSTTAAPAPTPAPAAAAPAASSNSDRFRWPLSGRVITDFAASGGTGINIEAAEGTTIRAAEAGEVIYVGNAVEGYGNLVLIRHPNGFVSAYAHLQNIGVVRGDSVGRGDSIGTVGMTGSVTRPQLHFELRRGATPVDPAPLLAG